MTTTTEHLPARQNGNGGRGLNLRAPAGNVTTLKNLLETSKQQMLDVLPKHLTPERIVRVTLLAVNKTPRLLDCSMESILQSIMQAASLGLDPGGVIGDGYLIPYKGQCQFQPGYRGLVKLARQSGELRDITADVVYEHDKFVYRKGDDAILLHEPDLRAEKRDEDIIGAYMVAEFKSGGRHREWMTRQEIEKARKCSNGDTTRNDSPWVRWYPEMCKKTVLKRGSKLLPLSSDRFAQAMEIESDQYEDQTPRGEAGQRGVAGLMKHITARPVSENQTFEPAPEAVEEAAAIDGPAVEEQQPDPDTSGAEAEQRASDGGDALAAEAAEQELQYALAGDWSHAAAMMADAAERAGTSRSDAVKAIQARVRVVLGMRGKEDQIDAHERRRIYEACSAGRLTLAGAIAPENS